MADPNLIARQYQQSMSDYLSDLADVMLEAAVDYHRVNLLDPVDQVLARFLIGRQRGKR